MNQSNEIENAYPIFMTDIANLDKNIKKRIAIPDIISKNGKDYRKPFLTLSYKTRVKRINFESDFELLQYIKCNNLIEKMR